MWRQLSAIAEASSTEIVMVCGSGIHKGVSPGWLRLCRWGSWGDIIPARQRCPAKITAFGKPRHGARPAGPPLHQRELEERDGLRWCDCLAPHGGWHRCRLGSFFLFNKSTYRTEQ